MPDYRLTYGKNHAIVYENQELEALLMRSPVGEPWALYIKVSGELKLRCRFTDWDDAVLFLRMLYRE